MMFTAVSLSDFLYTISQKIDAARITKVTKKCSTQSPGNLFILWSKGERSRSRNKETLPACVFAFLWVLASSIKVSDYRAIVIVFVAINLTLAQLPFLKGQKFCKMSENRNGHIGNGSAVRRLTGRQFSWVTVCPGWVESCKKGMDGSGRS